MPPKQAPSKKTVQKKKEKVVEDKTFGLKNKKGAKNQKFIEQVKKQVNNDARHLRGENNDQKAKEKQDKEARKKAKEELNALFKPVLPVQKIQADVDPKSVLCAFFKQGQCTKGNKCKFSHDLAVERKAAKRSLYDAQPEDKNEMEGWDQEELERVVNKRHGEKNKSLPPTQIICKYFLDAVEDNKYGWFWECPNGEKCHYKHAIPPGFILKKDKKQMEERKEVISLEDLIESERQKLGMNLTKVTFKTFMEWKQRKRKQNMMKQTQEKAKKQKSFKKGNYLGISGREMFEFNPELIVDEQDDGDVFDSALREEEDIACVDLDVNGFVELDDDGKPVDQNLMAIDEELFVAEDLSDIEDQIEELAIEE